MQPHFIVDFANHLTVNIILKGLHLTHQDFIKLIRNCKVINQTSKKTKNGRMPTTTNKEMVSDSLEKYLVIIN